MASAVVVDGRHYLVDFGLGCVRAAHEAGLRGKDLAAAFITHLHSDHVGELPAYLMWNWGKPVDGFTSSVRFLGPGRDTFHPNGAQLSGTRDMIEHTLRAFSYDLDIRVTDEGRPDMRGMLDVEEIAIPGIAAGAGHEPFVVYKDERVTVSAVLVEHPPVYPAFAFRFDTEAGSITFSGDTAESQALVRLASGTDILVHEAVNIEFFAARGFDEAFLNHQRKSHTSPEGAGRIAAASGAGRLILSHLAGVASADEWRTRAESTFSGPVEVATSGQRFDVVREPARATL
ncbi:MBL fold metallo-hydrolase [Paeniglutamicibacter sp. MACA_103]|uniref:MBL fold metallo-hydrolase n=1 Tax=Paeniglutamicibacter sp. MACA_103 TaxID=3377337 RepID=UPI003893535E